jgi:hypothetical protein
MRNELKLIETQERLIMSYSPILGVSYGLKHVNVENEVNEWEPENIEEK